MIRRQQRFQPEVYLKKAENDIKRVQMLCSLAEPPWDGFRGCGLVLLNEDDTAISTDHIQETESAAETRQEIESQESQTERQQWQIETLNHITQQIQGVARVSAQQRGEALRSIASEASIAAKRCDPQIAEQLKKLAEFAQNACREPCSGTGGSGGVSHSQDQAKPAAASSQEDVKAKTQDSRAVPKGAAGANMLYKASLAAYHEKKLEEALQHFEEALELCPTEKLAARTKIQDNIAIVRAQLMTKVEER